MKKLLIIALSLVSMASFAQVSSTATATAEVLAGLTLDCDPAGAGQALAMGAFVSEAGVSTATSTDAVERGGLTPAGNTVAICALTGAGGSTVNFNIDATATLDHDVNGATDQLTIDLTAISEGGVAAVGSFTATTSGTLTLDASGSDTIEIDGKIDADDGITPYTAGTYTGSFNVSVAY